MTTTLRIAVVYPDLLGTYGDGGNGLILARRAQWRGVEVDLVQATSDAPLPEADIYCLGGGEDGPQVRAARSLIEDGTLGRRVAEGAAVLAVCAGYQIVGKSFPGADGVLHEGVGLLNIATVKGTGTRAVGEVVAEAIGASLPELTGFENHGGSTTLAPGTATLGAGQCRDRQWGRYRHRGRRRRPRARHLPARARAGARIRRWPTSSCVGRSTPKSSHRSMTPPRRLCARNASAPLEDPAGARAGCDVEAPGRAERPHEG